MKGYSQNLEMKRLDLSYKIEYLDRTIKNYTWAMKHFDIVPPKADLQSRKRLLEKQLKEIEDEIHFNKSS